MSKTEGSPIRLRRNFGRSNSWKNPLAKVVDFEPLGAHSGPGAPDSDLVHSRIDVPQTVACQLGVLALNLKYWLCDASFAEL